MHGVSLAPDKAVSILNNAPAAFLPAAEEIDPFEDPTVDAKGNAAARTGTVRYMSGGYSAALARASLFSNMNGGPAINMAGGGSAWFGRNHSLYDKILSSSALKNFLAFYLKDVHQVIPILDVSAEKGDDEDALTDYVVRATEYGMRECQL